MADFDQKGALDLPQAQEASEESQEQFREKLAAAQKALKQIKKDEGKRKKQDNHLARIITYFLQSNNNTDLAGLVAALVEKDVPSDFILAILSLVDSQSKEVILLKKEQLALEGGESFQNQKKLVVFEADLWKKLPPELKTEIDNWFEHIYLIAKDETEKIMKKTLDQDLNINPNILQLTSFLMQKFLQKHQQTGKYDQIYEFVHFALKKIYEKLQIEFAEKMQLGANV